MYMFSSFFFLEVITKIGIGFMEIVTFPIDDSEKLDRQINNHFKY